MQPIILGLILIVDPITSNAYFDPGTGSLIIQALIGGLAAVTVFWGRVKSFVRSLFARQSERTSPVSAGADNQSNDTTETEE